jgi:acyl-CoA oxidase
VYLTSTNAYVYSKFAEGDSRILLQKLARDRVRDAAKGADQVDGYGSSSKETKAVMHLGGALMKGGKKNAAATWQKEWQGVYALAEAVCDRILDQWVPRSKF